MRENRIRAKQARRFKLTTDSNHEEPVAGNLLQRRFEVEEPNKVWVSDITYICTSAGWMYLAVILDLYSRRVVGWSISNSMTSRLTCEALALALQQRQPGGGLIHHSDRGVQYACGEYRALLRNNAITCSMSRKGDCWDNAVAESFFKSLKSERVRDRRYLSREEARADIFDYIERFYNRQRRHSYVGNISPVQYELKNVA